MLIVGRRGNLFLKRTVFIYSGFGLKPGLAYENNHTQNILLTPTLFPQASCFPGEGAAESSGKRTRGGRKQTREKQRQRERKRNQVSDGPDRAAGGREVGGGTGGASLSLAGLLLRLGPRLPFFLHSATLLSPCCS